jgi:hypothetical protein
MRIRRGTPRASWMHYQNHQLITPVRLAVSPVSWLDEGSGKDWCEERAFSVGGGGAEDPCVHLGAVSETVMLHACLALINILLLRSVPPFLPASSSLLSCLLPILLFFSLSFSHSSILSPFNFSSLGPLPQPPLSAYNLTIDTLTRAKGHWKQACPSAKAATATAQPPAHKEGAWNGVGGWTRHVQVYRFRRMRARVSSLSEFLKSLDAAYRPLLACYWAVAICSMQYHLGSWS